MLILKELRNLGIVCLHCQDGFVNNPLFHFPETHYSLIPVFQHSNWGEAPKFRVWGGIMRKAKLAELLKKKA